MPKSYSPLDRMVFYTPIKIIFIYMKEVCSGMMFFFSVNIITFTFSSQMAEETAITKNTINLQQVNWQIFSH